MKTLIVVFVVTAMVSGALKALWAHETKVVGNRYKVIVGMVREPAFTNERNGLDLIIRRADNNEPVENLERSLSAVLIAPDGRSARPLKIRAQFGRPGYYTDDFILTQPGVYKIRVFGIIADLSIDEMFESHEVRKIEELRFP